MGFFDDLKDSLGFDSTVERAQEKAEEAAAEAVDAQAEADKAKAKGDKDADELQQRANELKTKAEAAKSHAEQVAAEIEGKDKAAAPAPTPAPESTQAQVPAPEPAPESTSTPVQPEVAPAPDYTRSVPSPQVQEEPAAQARSAEPDKADRHERSAAPVPPAHHADKTKDEAPRFRTYTVKAGDTLSEIGQRFGVPYMEIARINQIKNPDLIFPGQKFKIPND